MRVNVNIPDDFLPKIDAYAEKMHLSRSAAITMMCGSYLESQEEALDVLKNWNAMQKKFLQDGTLPSDEALDSLAKKSKALQKPVRRKKAE